MMRRVFAIAALVVVIGLAVGTARSLHIDERLGRIETGLPPINWKGEPHATMPLRDRMAHYHAPGAAANCRELWREQGKKRATSARTINPDELRAGTGEPDFDDRRRRLRQSGS